jgi:hypothetical protein
MHKRSIWIALLVAHFFAHCLCGQSYTIEKLVMTGDDVPGKTIVTEQFAYFNDVHIFPDSQVGFSGFTTRTGSVFRSKPRGIYLSNTSGTLSVIAEIDDAEAWRSFGLPYSELDSDASKTFAYSWVDASVYPWVLGLAKATPGQNIDPLSPVDGSSMIVSKVNMPDFQGIFTEIWGGIQLNTQGKVLAVADFEFTNDPENDKRGVFVANAANDIRNVVFSGDVVPGWSNTTFGEFNYPLLADNGNVFFSAALTGDGIESWNNETLWMENNGEFILLLQEGSPAPGLPDYDIRLTALVTQVITVKGDNMVVFAGASETGGALQRFFWIGNTDGTGLTPFLSYYSSPVLEDLDYFTITEVGDVAFTNVDGNTILMDNNGNVYFSAGGKFANEESIGGIWKYENSTGIISLLVQDSFEAGQLFSYNLLAINDIGGIAFQARKDWASGGNRGIYARRPSGVVENILEVGDLVNERPVIAFAIYGGAKTLGSNKKLNLMNNKGDLAFVAQFDDTPNDSDNNRDEAIMLATAPVLPTERYLWNGGGGDSDWHKVLSWEDLDIHSPATRIPGDEAGTEVVVVNDRDINIDEKAVHLKELMASGSLDLNQDLTLEADSSIGDLTVNASITTNGELSLTQEKNVWKLGDIQGDGKVTLKPTASLKLEPAVGPLSLMTEFYVNGQAFHNDTQLNLVGPGSKLTIGPLGSYEISGGSIVDDSDGIHIENNFIIKKVGTGTATIDAFLENKPIATVIVSEGSLEFTDPSNWAGNLQVDQGATAIFDNSPVLLGTPSGDGFTATGDLSMQAGLIRFSASEVLVSAGDTVVFDLKGASGMVEFTDDAHITGSGDLVNKGNMVLKDAFLEASFRNEGTFTMEGDTSQFEAGAENTGKMELKGAGVLGPLSGGEGLHLKNKEAGELVKQGNGNFDVHLDSTIEGRIELEEGSLTFWKKLVFGPEEQGPNTESVVRISNGAELNMGVLGGPELIFNATKTYLIGLGDQSLCTIDAADIVLGADGQLFLQVNTHWKRGSIRPTFFGNPEKPNLSIGNSFSPATLLIEQQDPSLELSLGDDLTAKPIYAVLNSGSRIIQNTPLILWGFLHVKGSYRLNASTIRRLTFQTNPSSLFIDNGAGLSVGGVASIGERVENGSVPLDINTRGIVELDENCILNLTSLTAIKDGFPGKHLDAGFWFLEDNAEVTLPDVPDSQINGIGQAVLYLSAGSKFSNLPSVPGDFSNGGVLTLESTEFSTSGSFTNKETAGLYLINGTVTVGTTFQNKGIVEGTGDINGFVHNTGTMSPGLSPGIITIDGDFTQEADGELILELAAGQPGTDYDQLNITGIATLGGTLTIDCLDDTFPENDTAFAAIVASSFSGDFDQVIVNLPSSRQTFDLDVEGSELVARATTLNISTFSGWSMGVFTDSEQADGTISGLSANPDGDAYSNLLEYVFDTNPKLASDPQIEAQYSYDQGKPTEIHVTFPWANDVTDATVKLQQSNDMVTWVDLPSTETGSVDEGVVTRTTLTAAMPDENPVFVRLVVML